MKRSGPPKLTPEEFEESFDGRYWPSAYQNLTQLLNSAYQGSVSYAHIGRIYGVSRERVRRWNAFINPGVSLKEERRVKKKAEIDKKEMERQRRAIEDPSISLFYTSVKEKFPHVSIEAAGNRKFIIDGQKIYVTKVLHDKDENRFSKQHPAYYLVTGADTNFYFYHIEGTDYLFIPATNLPSSKTTFVDSPRSKYSGYKNTFEALKILISPS